MGRRVPFNKPCIAGKELHYIAQAVTEGRITGDGTFTRGCADLLQGRFDIPRVLMTPSCTAALEMAAMLCDLRPGDEVIMPSYTFVSTANAVVRTGARPVFVDIRGDTLNLDESKIAAAINERTKAIFVVHYAGVACRMDRILPLAEEHGLLVVEDAAQAVNAFFAERALGSIAPLGTYSFHETKNLTCGEGGALCINDERLIERAEILRDKGTNRQAFFRGQTDKYTWVDIGSSYVPSEISCAFLFAQLENMDEIGACRRSLYERYYTALQPLADKGCLTLPQVPDQCRTNHHLFHLLLPDAPCRDALLRHLNDRGIQAVFHYVPLHSSPMGKKHGRAVGDLSVTDSCSQQLLRLPLFRDLSEEDQAWIVDEIFKFFDEL